MIHLQKRITGSADYSVGRAESRDHFRKPMPTNIKRRGYPPDRRPQTTLHTLPEVPAKPLFAPLVLASRERYLRVAHRILRNREDAEDAVQDAFLSACRHFHTFEGRSSLTTWFTRIVINASLMLQRKRHYNGIKTLHEIPEDGSTLSDETLDPQPNPELSYAAAETHGVIESLVAKMPLLLRQALTMTYYEELSVPEASSVLGISPSTFKARLFRARHQLEDQVKRLRIVPEEGLGGHSFPKTNPQATRSVHDRTTHDQAHAKSKIGAPPRANAAARSETCNFLRSPLCRPPEKNVPRCE